MQRLRRHRGVTLIEAVLFISIAMGIIVGGLQFYQQAALALRTEQTVRLATALVAESRSLYRSTRIPDALARVRIDPVLDAAGSVPGNARSGNPAAPINSAWGDPVTLSSGLARLDDRDLQHQRRQGPPAGPARLARRGAARRRRAAGDQERGRRLPREAIEDRAGTSRPMARRASTASRSCRSARSRTSRAACRATTRTNRRAGSRRRSIGRCRARCGSAGCTCPTATRRRGRNTTTSWPGWRGWRRARAPCWPRSSRR
jgi:hypothetical protein